MAKKWTTLRKIEPPQEEEAVEEPDNRPLPRTPRRRKAARRGPPPPSPDEAAPREVDAELEVGNLSEESNRQPEAELPSADGEKTTPSGGEKPNQKIEVDPRILVVHESASTYRLIEETFDCFTSAKVDSTSDVLSAFELAILRDYQLFIVAYTLPGLSGNLFYELISRAYRTGLGNRKLAPAVVFVRESDEPLPSEEMLQDVRIKAVWSKPLSIERMLDSVSSVIPRLDSQGTERGG